MQVKQKLRIISVVSVMAVIALLAVLVLTAFHVNRAMEAARIADAIISASYERLILRTDNHRTASERSKVQLIAKHRQVGELLKIAGEKFTDPEDKKTIRELLAIHEITGNFSRTIRENREMRESHTHPDAFSQETENRLIRQLDMKIYETILLNGKLQESSIAAVSSTLKLGGGSIALVFLLAGAVTLLNSATMNRAIAGRIGRLRQGASLIGEGNLDHRIDIKGDDEFAELADTFNAMTGKLYGSYRDLECEIEERRQAEASLKESEERFRSMFEHHKAIMLLIEPESGAIVDANTSAAEFYLLSREELCSLNIQVINQMPTDEVAAQRRMAAKEEQDHFVFPHLLGTGETRWVEVYSTPVVTQGAPLLFSIIHDITTRRQAEEALQKAHNDLAEQVEERTRELREKEVLLKEIHHRVKNNLQVISSLVSLQADGSQDEMVREVLRDVTYRVRSMALVHEKLYQSASLSRIDFAEYTRGLLGYLWRAHGSAAATARLNLVLEPVSLPVDTAVPCGLILNELAGNALKHAFRGRAGGEVTVSLHGNDDGRISLCVADNGIGLPEGLDWCRANSLGLRLVQMLAGQLGAAVEVNSGEGTRFEISFSRGDAESAEKTRI